MQRFAYNVHIRTMQRRAAKRSALEQQQFIKRNASTQADDSPSTSRPRSPSPVEPPNDYFKIITTVADVEEEEYYIEDEMFDKNTYLFSDDEDEDDVEEDEEGDEDMPCEESPEILQIRQLVTEHRLRRKAVEAILLVLRSCGVLVPKTYYGLFKSIHSEKITTTKIDGGEYFHYGIAKALKKKKMEAGRIGSEIILDIGIDGIPLFKSSNSAMWPILGRIVNNPYKKPFVIGAFVGYGKPGNVNEFLSDLVSEMKNLQVNGLNLASGLDVQLSIRLFACDAPARAMVKGTKGHASKEGCQECSESAEYDKTFRKMVYSTEPGPPRSDEEFASRSIPMHHLSEFKTPGSHILEQVGVKMQSQFPVDVMHNVDLGVIRKTLFLIEKTNCLGLKRADLRKSSNEYKDIRKYIPSEFQRKPRGMDQISHWKAVEGRLFALYTGLIYFKSLGNEDLFYHFTLLNVVLRLLSSPQFSQHLSFCQALLEAYVQNYGVFYGEKNITYNVHNLLHLLLAAVRYGPIYSFSCYPFENFMQEIKGHVRTAKNIIQQLFNRMQEADMSEKPEQKARGICGSITNKSSTGRLFKVTKSNIILNHQVITGSSSPFLRDVVPKTTLTSFCSPKSAVNSGEVVFADNANIDEEDFLPEVGIINRNRSLPPIIVKDPLDITSHTNKPSESSEEIIISDSNIAEDENFEDINRIINQTVPPKNDHQSIVPVKGITIRTVAVPAQTSQKPKMAPQQSTAANMRLNQLQQITAQFDREKITGQLRQHFQNSSQLSSEDPQPTQHLPRDDCSDESAEVTNEANDENCSPEETENHQMISFGGNTSSSSARYEPVIKDPNGQFEFLSQKLMLVSNKLDYVHADVKKAIRVSSDEILRKHAIDFPITTVKEMLRVEGLLKQSNAVNVAVTKELSALKPEKNVRSSWTKAGLSKILTDNIIFD